MQIAARTADHQIELARLDDTPAARIGKVSISTGTRTRTGAD
jgi:hypothetical protein